MYDILIIGGGINGAGIARDASGRNLNVILVEKGKVGEATSSWSTKLIHGGLRYLENYEFKLVRESLKERSILNKIASSMMGNVLVTKQTGEIGKTVNRIFIEEGCEIEREFYLSLLVDRNTSKVMMMISAAGGMDIEEVAATNPEKIRKSIKLEI